MIFSTSYDSTTLFLTLLGVAVLIFSVSIILILGRFKILKIVLILFILSILITAFVRSPRAFIITDSEIVIKTISKSIKIPISSVEEVERLKEKDLKGAKRMKGVGGLFGFSGKFYSDKIGYFDGYFTNQKNLVLIKTEKSFVISPDNPDLFIEKINLSIRKRDESHKDGNL